MGAREELAAIRERVEAATEGPWEESWRQIPGYDGYEVSDFGNVRSYYLKGNHKQKRAEFPRLLALRGKAYPSVQLPVGGRYQNRAVHRLVMLAFVGPCPEGMEVAHLNGVNSDNRLPNLKYVTHAENEAHKAAHGTSGTGEGNSSAVLQGWQVAEIKFLAAKSIPQGRIAALFEIDHKQVNDILRGRSWSGTPARTDAPRMVATLERLLGLADEWEHAAIRRADITSDLFDATSADYYRSRAADLREAIEAALTTDTKGANHG